MRSPTTPTARARAGRIAAGLLIVISGLLPSAVALAAETDTVEPADLIAEGRALIESARLTADPDEEIALLDRARTVYTDLRDRDPASADAYVGLGTVALSMHGFEAALDLALEAVRLAPASAPAHGVLTDALIELGRYEEAGAAIEDMLRARPDLASFSRLSYFHELHGRTDLAIDAMERALLSAGSVDDSEFARVLLGDLWRLDGDLERARRLYEAALERIHDLEPALHGLARIAAAEGDAGRAMALLHEAIAAVPEADTNVDLGELHAMSGDLETARTHFDTALALDTAARGRRAAIEPDSAILEAEHGDLELALELARAAYDAAPSILAADALAWALHLSGRTDEAAVHAREALRTGQNDPATLYRAGVIAAAAGDIADARELLEGALEGAAAGSPLLRTRIERALGDLPAP